MKHKLLKQFYRQENVHVPMTQEFDHYVWVSLLNASCLVTVLLLWHCLYTLTKASMGNSLPSSQVESTPGYPSSGSSVETIWSTDLFLKCQAHNYQCMWGFSRDADHLDITFMYGGRAWRWDRERLLKGIYYKESVWEIIKTETSSLWRAHSVRQVCIWREGKPSIPSRR